MFLRNNPAKPFITFFIGILCTLFVFEAGLRIFASRYAAKPPVAARQPGVFRILCLGDSFVFGLGAPPDKSYPRQLEEMLNRSGLPRKVEVVNYGFTARNTSELYAVFSRDVDTLKPDLLLFTGGMNNGRNLYGYHAFRRGEGFFPRLQDFAESIRLRRLAALLAAAVRARRAGAGHAYSFAGKDPRFPAALEYYSLACKKQLENDRREAAALARKALATDPSYALPYRLLGEIYESDGRMPEAIDCYRKLLETIPDPDKAWHLGALYHKAGNYEEAFRTYARGLEMEDRILSFNPCLTGFQTLVRDAGAHPVRGKAFAFLERIRPRMDKDGRQMIDDIIADRIEAGSLDAWRTRDINRIVDGCRRRRIPVILVDYPEENTVLEEIAIARRLPYIGNRTTFEALLKNKPRLYYFFGDEHCNGEGYRVMAGNAAKKILELNLIR